MAVIQSSELIRFISNIPVTSDGTVPLNQIESNSSFVSEMFEPVYSLSVLARFTQNILNSDKIEVVNDPIDEHTVTSKVLDSDLSSYAPHVYLLVRVVVLESFSLIYHIQEDRKPLRYVSTKDIQRIKNNIGYVADFMGTESKYYKMIGPLRDMNVSLGYIENQIDVIVSEGV